MITSVYKKPNLIFIGFLSKFIWLSLMFLAIYNVNIYGAANISSTNNLNEAFISNLQRTAGRIIKHRSPLREAAKALIVSGLDVNYENELGITPLIAAIESDSHEIVNLLLEKGANINGENKFGETPIMYLVACRKDTLGLYEAKRLIKSLIDKGANINTINKNGVTALGYAAQKNLFGRFKFLLDCGADFTLKDKEGFNIIQKILLEAELNENEDESEIRDDIINQTCNKHIREKIRKHLSRTQKALDRREEIKKKLNDVMIPVSLVNIINSYLPDPWTDFIDSKDEFRNLKGKF